MKVDFRKIKVTDLYDNVQEVDVSKALGNLIFNNTKDLGEFEVAREIFKNGEVDINKEMASRLKIYAAGFERIIVQEAIKSTLDMVDN